MRIVWVAAGAECILLRDMDKRTGEWITVTLTGHHARLGWICAWRGRMRRNGVRMTVSGVRWPVGGERVGIALIFIWGIHTARSVR